MDLFYRPTRVEICLDSLRHNLTAFRKMLPKDIALMAVVKADAYGHGAVQVAREAIDCGVSYLAVALLDEALELRNAGIDAPILVLGYTPARGLAAAIEHDITLAVYTDEILDAFAGMEMTGRKAKIHIKLDTGMGRIGVPEQERAIAFIERALALPEVEVEGLFTHYACADERDKTCTLDQYGRFTRIAKHFADKGIRFDYVHAGNSAAAIDTPGLAGNMVRLGISMYGSYPSDEVDRSRIDLKPVMSFKTGISMLKTMPEGAGISYGHRYHTRREGERIATLPVGYADGFSRLLNGKAHVLIRGRRVPVVGTICMDQCMVDVSDVPNVSLDDEVVLIGSQDGKTISFDEVAAQMGTISYEVKCMISHRVPRVYRRGGEVVQIVNPLQHR